MTTTTVDPLAYYAAHGCALFPIPAGFKEDPGWKNGTGIIKHFSREWSRDPSAWAAWRQAHPSCNFGLVSGPSHLAVADIDISEVGRDAAWAAWSNWWQSRGLAVPMPQFQSARGGWHCLFAMPDDTGRLRQVPLIGAIENVSKKPIVDMRVGNGYVVAAGSYYDGSAEGKASGYYQMLSDAAPYSDPATIAALIEACGRRVRRDVTIRVGFSDPNDTQRVLEWMMENDGFASYHQWIEAGMILRGEFGDEPGFALWQTTNDGSASVDDETKHWNSFSSDLTVDDVKMGTLRKRAIEMKCPHPIRKNTAEMFKGVAAMVTPPSPTPGAAATVATIAADAGASLPLPEGAKSLAGNTSKVIADLGQPILENFLEAVRDVPFNPSSSNFPQLPSAALENYPSIFDDTNNAIRRIIAMAETPRSFKQQRVLKVLSVLNQMHQTTYQAVVDRINALGCALTPSRLEQENKQFEVNLVAIIQDKDRAGFHADSKNKPDPAISDNIGIFLRLSGHRVRWDTFPRKAEVARTEDDEFARFDQPEIDRLWMLAKSAAYNYHPARDVFRIGVKVEARKDSYDSLEDEVLRLARNWDGTPRLDRWMSQYLGVEDNRYHQIVGRNLIGGMVRRARYHGCKHDETVVLISPDQGQGKSTLCKILALKDEWFLGKFRFGQSDQNGLPLLAGKWIVELGELAGLNKTDIEDVKSFLTETKDEYVAKYDSEPTENLRRCIFVGTSNNLTPLNDISGNRRFLPVRIAMEIDLDRLRADVGQIIGEAAVRDEKGESFAIPRDAYDLTKAVQEASRHISPIEEACRNWFEREGSFYITSADLMNAFRLAGLSASTRPGAHMQQLGWRSAQVGPSRDRVWIKHANNDVTDCIQLIPAQTQANGRVEMRVIKTVTGTELPALPPPLPQR